MRRNLIPDSMTNFVIVVIFVIWVVLYIPGWLVRRLRDPDAV